MESLIRWKKGDYIRLGTAVSRFNKIINEMEVDEEKILPDLKNYKDIKEHITSRKELNRVIKSLQNANVENLQATHTFESGEKISQYEWKEIKKAERRALRNLANEKEMILKDRQSIGMGDERLSEIKAIENSFKTIQEKTGSDLKRLLNRIQSIGRSDYKLSRDLQFKENFYKALEGISNFNNYDVLKKELDKIKNPTKFYEYVKKSPILMDLFLWYKESDSLFYGGFDNNQEAFNSSLLFHLGIDNIKT